MLNSFNAEMICSRLVTLFALFSLFLQKIGIASAVRASINGSVYAANNR